MNAAAPAAAPGPAIPALVVGGYLGAGKTTLINAFLRDPGGLRVTVLVNDFGAINIDAALIENAEGDTVALTNGCACCAIGNDLFEAARAATAGPRPPDLLLIEASGVARPARLRALLSGVGALAPARCLAVVNGRTAPDIAADRYVGGLFRTQIAEADSLMVNRNTPQGQAWLQSRFPEKLRITVLADLLLGQAGPGEGRRHRPAQAAMPDPVHPDPMHRAETLRLSGPLRPEALAAWLHALPPGVERVKGFVRVFDGKGGVETRYLSYSRGGFELVRPGGGRVAECGTLTLIARAGIMAHLPHPQRP